MHTPTLKRIALVVLSLAGAALACSRAEVPIQPAQVSYATPLPAANTPTEAASETPAPLPTAAATEALPTATLSADTPTAEVAASSDTPTAEAPTLEPTATTEVVLPTDTATVPPPVSGGSIPANAVFRQDFAITLEGGLLVGRSQDMLDGNTGTWASLRAGNALWIFNLGATANIVGIRLHPHKDGNEAITLTTIEVSADGATWTPVFAGSGDCGEPQCDTLTPDVPVDFGFGPVAAQYVRLRAGPAPARFAFSEVWVATQP